MLHQSASDRVQVHVPGHRPEVRLVFDQLGSIPALEHMPRKAVTPRPNIGIAGQKRLHTASEVGLRRLEDDVQVVGYDGKSVDAPTPAKRGFAEVFLKPIPWRTREPPGTQNPSSSVRDLGSDPPLAFDLGGG
jgi:hypothetical protein